MMKIQMESFSQPGISYEVDKATGHCSCPAYETDGWCKHLEAVGSFKPRRVTLSARPSFSQALSGLVKCIRLRDIDEGAYWLNYCWGFREKLHGSQYRTVRRLLIGSAEDGHSIAVMEKVAENFTALLAKDVEFSKVLAELVRICKVSNWWQPSSGGHVYIYSGMVASRRRLYDAKLYSMDHCLSEMGKAIDNQDRIEALFWMNKADEAGKGASLAIANRLFGLAVTRNHEPAIRLTQNVHLLHAKALHDDNNFIGQAAWLLAGGESPVIDQIEVVTQGEVRHLLDQVVSTEPYVIPEWCCDGVHCAGNDVRYIGMFHRMNAVCNQYNHYKRVSPDDPWLEDQFYTLDGLALKPSE